MAFVIKPLNSFKAQPQGQEPEKLYLYSVDPLSLEEEDGFNLRYYDDPKVIAHIEAFCASYLSGRHVPPMVVHADGEGRLTIIEGHCRRRGLHLAIERGARIPLVSVIPFQGNDAQCVELMLRSAQGLKLETLDIARGYLRLVNMGYTPAAIATSQNKTLARVEQLLLLATAGERIQALVRSGLVSADAAIEALQTHGEAAWEALNQRLDKARLEGRLRITRTSAPRTAPPRRVVDTVFAQVEAAIASMPEDLRHQAAALRKLPEAERATKTVEVSAQVLIGLMQAAREIETMKRRRAKRLQRSEAAAQAVTQAGASPETLVPA